MFYRIKVNYQVVDPSVEAAKNRLDAMKHGRYSIQRMKKKKSETRSSLGNKTEKTQWFQFLKDEPIVLLLCDKMPYWYLLLVSENCADCLKIGREFWICFNHQNHWVRLLKKKIFKFYFISNDKTLINSMQYVRICKLELFSGKGR